MGTKGQLNAVASLFPANDPRCTGYARLSDLRKPVRALRGLVELISCAPPPGLTRGLETQ
jgi:hypothetical protein